jgi:hypothetical protein
MDERPFPGNKNRTSFRLDAMRVKTIIPAMNWAKTRPGMPFAASAMQPASQ